jgi:folate-binding protein YgfZ
MSRPLYHSAKLSIKPAAARVVIAAARRYSFASMAKESALAEAHRARGARFGERNGWVLPEHFGDSTAEYRAARESVGMFDLSHRGLLQFTGPDRAAFLQGMLSNDVKLLNPFDGQYAALLTQQGKVVADARVLCAMNSFYLDFWEFLKEKILAHLNRYLIADEVEIADRSGEYATLSLQGPRSEELLRAASGATELPRRPAAHAMIQIAGAAVCVVAAGRAGETGFDLILPRSDMAGIAQLLEERGKPLAARWAGAAAQEILRIEAGIPLYGVDFDENHLLLEVSLENAVSFSKGCYLGQEVVERIRSRGHVNKRLSGLVLEGEAPVQAGDAVVANDKAAGAVTSSVLSPLLHRPVALAYINRDFWDPGTRVVVRSAGSERPATVSALPFTRFS